MTDDEIKQVQELYEWHADHLDYRAPALAALMREHAAMKAALEGLLHEHGGVVATPDRIASARAALAKEQG